MKNDVSVHASGALWLGAAFIGFVVWWPIGAAILFSIFATALAQQIPGFRVPSQFLNGSSGNSVFDEYRQDALRKLEEDRVAFGSFVDKLHRAKDRKEFDQFMKERRPTRLS